MLELSLFRSPMYFAVENGMSSIILLLYELNKNAVNLTSIMNRPAVFWVDENNQSNYIGLVHLAVSKKQLGVLSLLIELVKNYFFKPSVCMYVCIYVMYV